MDKHNKTLLCVYVDDFCGIKNEIFNFCAERRYKIENHKINRNSKDEIKDFPTNFWGKNVSAVTLLIGENGAGKTTLIRLLIKWLCQLSEGHIPQEKGALVIRVDDEDKLIAFDNGNLWKNANANEEIVLIEDVREIVKLLQDIRLAYYTDTMTDLELNDSLTNEEIKFLYDDSLITRLSDIMSSGRYAAQNIKDCIKQKDFDRQMNLYLYFKEIENANNTTDNVLEFPIPYMKFTTIRAGDKEVFKHIYFENDSLIQVTVDFWNIVFERDDAINMSDAAKALLWGIFSGTIVSLISWEKTIPNLKDYNLSNNIKELLVSMIRSNHGEWNSVYNSFFANLFNTGKDWSRDNNRYEEFYNKWNICFNVNIIGFVDVLKNIESDNFFKNKWEMFEYDENICKWGYGLENFNDVNEGAKWLQDWEKIWKAFQKVEYLMPECKFDWKYVSSGEKNQCNLYANLFNIVKKFDDNRTKHLWILLDEPDNAFHPDWKRKIIWELLKICSIFETNFQFLISTHSPIMLSDMPKQAAILLKNDKNQEEKQQKYLKSSPFGQQIYTLFNDAFFMENGIIGAFADKKIADVYKELYNIEKSIVEGERDLEESELNECEEIIKLIDEPLLHGHLAQSYKLCKRELSRKKAYVQ